MTYDFAAELLNKTPAPENATPTDSIDFAEELLKGKRALVPDIGGGKFPGLNEVIKAISDPKMGADVETAFIGGVPTDKQSAIKYFAKQRGLPTSRYRVVDGDIAYQADDGKFYKEVAGFGAGAAYYAPDVIEAIPGAVTGVATAPLLLTPGGVWASTSATGAVDAAANLARQKIAQSISGQDVSGGQVALSGLLGGMGQLIPSAAVKVGQRNMVKDIANLNPQAVKDILGKSNSLGISLTPAEITNLSSLMGQQHVLANIPPSTQKVNKFYQQREVEQIRPAVEKYLDDISPVSDVAEAGVRGQAALRDAFEQLNLERKSITEPLYKEALDNASPVDVSPVVGEIDNLLKTAKGSQQSVLLRMKDLLHREYPKQHLNANGLVEVKVEMIPDTRLSALQNAKFEIDKMFKEEAFSSMDKKIQMEITQVQKRLVEQMGKDNPAYIVANDAFVKASEPLNKFEKSKAGLSLTAISPDNLNQFSKRLFESNSVSAIRYAREQIQKADPDAWDAVTRSYMQEVWTNAKAPAKNQRGLKLDTGNAWQNMLIGDENSRAALRAALSPAQFQALTDLSEV